MLLMWCGVFTICPHTRFIKCGCGANSVYLDQGVNILQMFSSLLPLSWCIQVQNGKTPYFTSSLIIVVRLRKRCLVLLSNRWSRSFNCLSYIIIVDQNDWWCWFQLSGPVVHLSRPGSHRKASRPLFHFSQQYRTISGAHQILDHWITDARRTLKQMRETLRGWSTLHIKRGKVPWCPRRYGKYHDFLEPLP